MPINRPKKIIFKIAAFLALATFIFSCRGITLNKFTSHVDSPTPNPHPSCCTNLGEIGPIDIAHHNLMWSVIPQKSTLNILELIFIGIGLATATIARAEYRSYILTIRSRYGNFLILNYFINLFSRGLLNAKIF